MRSEYLLERDKNTSKSRQQEFARAIADKDKQIAQVESQIKERARDFSDVKLLEEQMEDGKELEPVTVFYDGKSHWLADGFHRFSAHRNRGSEAIACVIHQSSRRDAVLYSVATNADHKPALPRNREDKRRAVLTQYFLVKS